MFNLSFTQVLATGELPRKHPGRGQGGRPPRSHPPCRPRLVWIVERPSAKFGSKYFPKRPAKKSPRCFLRHGNEPRLDLKHSYDGGSPGAPRASRVPRVRAQPGSHGGGQRSGADPGRGRFHDEENYEPQLTTPSTMDTLIFGELMKQSLVHRL